MYVVGGCTKPCKGVRWLWHPGVCAATPVPRIHLPTSHWQNQTTSCWRFTYQGLLLLCFSLLFYRFRMTEWMNHIHVGHLLLFSPNLILILPYYGGYKAESVLVAGHISEWFTHPLNSMALIITFHSTEQVSWLRPTLYHVMFLILEQVIYSYGAQALSLIHIWRCRRRG